MHPQEHPTAKVPDSNHDALSNAEQALRIAHEQAQQFINAVPSMLIGLDKSGCITRWNRAATKVFGFSTGEVMGKPLGDCGIQWGRGDMQAEIESWCREPRCRRIENVPLIKDDCTHFLGLALECVTAADEQTGEILIIGSDITERKNLEDQ